jgi:hypothetical protein
LGVDVQSKETVGKNATISVVTLSRERKPLLKCGNLKQTIVGIVIMNREGKSSSIVEVLFDEMR